MPRRVEPTDHYGPIVEGHNPRTSDPNPIPPAPPIAPTGHKAGCAKCRKAILEAAIERVDAVARNPLVVVGTKKELVEAIKTAIREGI